MKRRSLHLDLPNPQHDSSPVIMNTPPSPGMVEYVNPRPAPAVGGLRPISTLNRSDSQASTNSTTRLYIAPLAGDDEYAPSPSKTRSPTAWPAGSPTGKWTWKSRRGALTIAGIVVGSILFISLTSFGVAKAVQDRAASQKNAAAAEVTPVVSNVTSVVSSAGYLVTETSQRTSYSTRSTSSRFSTSVRSSATASGSASAAASASSAAATAATTPAFDYSAGPLFGAATNRSDCFPYALPATLSLDSAPSMNRSQWWCEPSLLYGFMGFSYPLEDADCSATTNSYAQINKDFARIKADFGATMVRVYAPECRDVSVWENLVRAGVENGMGVIVQIWWGFLDDQTLWETSQKQIYELFTTSEYAAVAPYVVHSASFGSEPLGDAVDGTSFFSDLASFRAKMNALNIPVGISEDWDRTAASSNAVAMNATDGSGLGATGKKVKANTDIVHAHLMPHYHPDEVVKAASSWGYIDNYLAWLNTYVEQPIFITESMWSSATSSSHLRGGSSTAEAQATLSSFKAYWNLFSDNCAVFKEKQVGWFFHTYTDDFEPYFGILSSASSTSPKFDFQPPSC